MTMDLVLRRARMAGAETEAPPMDIAILDGRIAAIEPEIESGADTVDLEGRLVSSGLVETHIHLDKSRIIDRCTPAAGRARDHMERVSAVKPGFTVEDVYARAAETLEQSILNGVTHMRTHVEVDPNVGLRGFEALQQLALDYAWGIDLELCVFAQEGWTNAPETDRNVVTALERGAAVVGGAPGYDPDHAGQIRRIFELAIEYDRDVDIHLDVGPTADEMDIDLVCALTERHGYGGRVAIGHGTKYSLLPPDRLRNLGERLASAGVAVTKRSVAGRHQDHSVVRGVADANALIECGANCSLSTNNVLNPFTPFGDCSLIRIANLYANVVQRGNEDELAECFEMLTRRSARLLRRDDYGIAVGRPADLVVWDARSPAEAVARIAAPLHGFKRGRRTFTRILPELNRP